VEEAAGELRAGSEEPDETDQHAAWAVCALGAYDGGEEVLDDGEEVEGDNERVSGSGAVRGIKNW
jgi:hypothetical protein